MKKEIDPNMPIYVYVLIDPRTNIVRYVGITSRNINDRLSEHLYEASPDGKNAKNHRCNWIRSLLSNNLRPLIQIIDETVYSNMVNAERYWISYYGRENLVNGTDGGEGSFGWIPSLEQRKNLSEKLKGREVWNKGIPMRDESKIKLSESKKGKVAYNKGLPMADSQKEKLSEIKRVGLYKGTSWIGRNNRWQAKIKINNERIYFGTFKKEALAAICFDMLNLFFNGFESNINFPNSRQSYIDHLNNYEISDIKRLREVIKLYLQNLE